MNVKEIDIDKVKIIENTRVTIKNLEGLMQDIKQHGLKQAIGVIEKDDEYILVWGHRRLSACKKLGWKKIPANICPDMELADLLINNSAENIHREETNPMELGRICHRLRTEMGLTPSEIAARLSVPISRITGALHAYGQLPDKYRSRVAYIQGSQMKNGNISAAVANRVISIKRQHGLSDSSFEKLLSIARKEELSLIQLNVIGKLLDEGNTVAQAIQNSENYVGIQSRTIVDRHKLERLLVKYKMDSAHMLIQNIIYGEIPPINKPGFVKIKQSPAKN